MPTTRPNWRREARDYGRGVPSTGGSIRLGLSRRADSDTPAADLIGRVARMQAEWEKILCNIVLPAALTGPRRPGGSGARTFGPGDGDPVNWCSELPDAQSRRQLFGPMAFCLHGCDDLTPARSQVLLRLY